jgi:uracil-DNA glycosylase
MTDIRSWPTSVGTPCRPAPPKKAQAEQAEPSLLPCVPQSSEPMVSVQRANGPTHIGGQQGRLWWDLEEAPEGKVWELMFYKANGICCRRTNTLHHLSIPTPSLHVDPMCDLRAIKVFLLEQDPCHGPAQAHRLCFSIQRPFYLHPVWKTFTKSSLQTWMVLFSLAVETYSVGQTRSSSLSQSIKPILMRREVVSWLNQNVMVLSSCSGALVLRRTVAWTGSDTMSWRSLSVYRRFFGCRQFSKTY